MFFQILFPLMALFSSASAAGNESKSEKPHATKGVILEWIAGVGLIICIICCAVFCIKKSQEAFKDQDESLLKKSKENLTYS